MDARSWAAAGSTLFLLYLYLGILVCYAGRCPVNCSPANLIWIFTAMVIGGTIAMFIIMWGLEKWMNEITGSQKVKSDDL